MSMHYLKIEVAKYICSLLRIFKIALQTQQILWFNNQIQITMPLEQGVQIQLGYNCGEDALSSLFLLSNAGSLRSLLLFCSLWNILKDFRLQYKIM